MLKFISALFALLLLCGPASATVYYVNGATGNNGDTTAGWGLTPDSPLASPTYGVTLAHGNAGNHDTLYIYGMNQTEGDSNNYYYGDAINVAAAKFIDFVGVSNWSDWRDSSVCNDSPIFYSDAAGTIRIYYQCATTERGYVVDGLYITGARHSGVLYNDYLQASIRNCVFDSIAVSPTPDAIYSAAIQAGSDVAALSNTMNVDNCVFKGNAVANVGALGFTGAAAEAVTVMMSRCTMREDSCAFLAENIDSASFYVVDSVINADTIFYATVTSAALNIRLEFAYCDFFDTANETQFASVPVVFNTLYQNNLYLDPGFSDAFDNRGYFNSGWEMFYTNATVGTGSSTGGVIGVSWGFTAAAPAAAVTRRNSFFFSRWARVLGIGL